MFYHKKNDFGKWHSNFAIEPLTLLLTSCIVNSYIMLCGGLFFCIVKLVLLWIRWGPIEQSWHSDFCLNNGLVRNELFLPKSSGRLHTEECRNRIFHKCQRILELNRFFPKDILFVMYKLVFTKNAETWKLRNFASVRVQLLDISQRLLGSNWSISCNKKELMEI